MKQAIKRRDFLRRSVTAGAGFMVLPSGILRAGNSPNEKLNVAVIGVGGRGAANLNGVKRENIVALCDIDANRLAAAAKRFPKAKVYADWRKCLEQKDIDAVVCSTTDHTHAFVNVWAMNRGKHVYCEKPLANSVYEARVVRETYLKNRDKLATQMGTQIHATDNFRRVVELIKAGAIGDVQECRVWCSRRPKGGSYLPAAGGVPKHINWDLWLGPSQSHAFNPGYVHGCLKWNRFWDFGSGQIGDMGSHMLDLPYWALDLRFPTSCKAEGTPVSTDTCPEWMNVTWDHPATPERPALKIHWYDGGKKPGMPAKVFNRDEMFKGMLFKGTKGWLLADYGFRILQLRGDMTHYDSPTPEQLIPKSPGHHMEWITGCKTGKPTLCNFDYSGALIEHNLLALVAYRTGQKLDWDAKSLRATNCAEADQFIKKTYRDGWVLNG
ncbi:MAG: Gfo/Idh/MocA family oxidoreductase [Lentisphaerae bacterium]|jgi:predicted dehydrogenase|nr:Gfo/Idh/MocA family oxidoreductase [Lentisphaerota bacterium]MBT4817818.1 Gfo/Idh/MocA family oxidoreductase [Lentisphaerota bacterium]MBT5605086.1 Gfo/Idh/MocA family oxidoreductase [Lentisphaerota bacterium]MBT7062229.1 Gfo/Idh/MocA family oxidoreductase [Lentisphaerota bacterium]MBT7847049.1 Gfo/Idh/MocA family oxidoreductase [Lentisphaerota bacterium]